MNIVKQSSFKLYTVLNKQNIEISNKVKSIKKEKQTKDKRKLFKKNKTFCLKN